jgi:P-type E1-E2 ATPase
MVGTFALVLIFTMIKEAVEDLSRHKSDREVNNKEVLVFDNTALKYVLKKWQHIKTGEIMKVLKDQEFPADMVLLKSEKDSGIVFVDTMNLDGEVILLF